MALSRACCKAAGSAVFDKTGFETFCAGVTFLELDYFARFFDDPALASVNETVGGAF